MRKFLLRCFIVGTCCNPAWVEAAQKLSFCYETWHPFAYVNETGETVGEHIEALEQALAITEYQVEFIELPFMRCLKQVRNGQIDFALHVDETDDFELINHPIGSWDLLLAYKYGQQKRLSVNEKNLSAKVLIARDYAYPQVVLDTLSAMAVEIIEESFYTNNSEEVKRLFKLLKAGFVDAILVDKSWVEYEMSRKNIQVTLSEEILYSQPQYIGYVDRNRATAQKVYSALVAMSQK